MISHLAEFPKSGVLIRGAGGIRKLRWARPGGGKSGGFRVIYYYHDERLPLYLLTMFGKNERANLSEAERNELAKLTKLILQAAGLKP
ncbi:type II toxin-antitoxin system RelE/ParE family toxin [Allohahella marinimesophila]|uniref:type II toxin-antitoxin system RelE/ParE family toxin n=1 Tax=Allohahella marinimesophila TaxID=1054972 RepID=UPI0031E2C6C0